MPDKCRTMAIKKKLLKDVNWNKIVESMPLATTTVNGLLSSSYVKNCLQSFRFGDSIIYKMGKLTSYTGVRIVGLELVTEESIEVHLFSDLNAKIKKMVIHGENVLQQLRMRLKKDEDNNIYIRVNSGTLVYGQIYYEGLSPILEAVDVDFASLIDI